VYVIKSYLSSKCVVVNVGRRIFSSNKMCLGRRVGRHCVGVYSNSCVVAR